MHRNGGTLTATARELGISRTTGYLWLKRYKGGNVKARRVGVSLKRTLRQMKTEEQKKAAYAENPFLESTEIQKIA